MMFFSIYMVVLMLYFMVYIMCDKGRGNMTPPIFVISYGLIGVFALFFVLFFVYLYTEILHIPLL